MLHFQTPGVYVREVEVKPPLPLRLSITGFVGQAERGPLHAPQPLTSWGQYQDIFGDFVGFSYLSYAVFGFFRNGGERCYVVRVAHERARKARCDLVDAAQNPVIHVEALNEGMWACQVTVLVETEPTHATGFKLTVRYQPGGILVRQEVFDNLSMQESDARYFVRIINGESEDRDYVQKMQRDHSILVRVADLCQSTTAACAPPRQATVPLTQGDDGPQQLAASYYTGYEQEAYFHPLPSGAAQLGETTAQLFGLATYEAVPDVGLVAVPDLILPDLHAAIPETQRPTDGLIFAAVPVDALPPEAFDNLRRGQHDMLSHCARMGDRFALLDAPRGAAVGRGATRVEDWPPPLQALPNAKYGALYYPWIRESTGDFGGRTLCIPPSGHLAGIYARTERERGIGKAPANEVIQGVVAFESVVSEAEQDILNPRGVNCLRAFPGRGLRVWGARTLSLDPLWRYVNVRRVCLAIIKQIVVNLQWTVFEPNDQRLWDKIVATLTLTLRGLFQSGALVGAKPEEAFFVKCDTETNPPDIVAEGRVVTLIGFAPARPAEFILVTIERTAAALTVRER